MPIKEFCGGPNCDKERPKYYDDPENFYSWPTIETADEHDFELFCSWTCLAAFAVNRATEREGTIWQK